MTEWTNFRAQCGVGCGGFGARFGSDIGQSLSLLPGRCKRPHEARHVVQQHIWWWAGSPALACGSGRRGLGAKSAAGSSADDHSNIRMLQECWVVRGKRTRGRAASRRLARGLEAEAGADAVAGAEVEAREQKQAQKQKQTQKQTWKQLATAGASVPQTQEGRKNEHDRARRRKRKVIWLMMVASMMACGARATRRVITRVVHDKHRHT